jgi:hypothetical protein
MARNIDYAAIQAGRDRELRTGALVMVKDEFAAKSRYTRPGALMVAIADKFDMVNCMEVGGGNYRNGELDHQAYARVPATWLRVVSPREALQAAYAPPERPARPARPR